MECCGNGPSTYVSNSPKGISIGPCFRCGERDWEPHGAISAAQLLAWRTLDNSVRGMQSYPQTCVGPDEWPADLLVWLGQAGISTDTASRELGVTYAPDLDRAIIPIVQSGTARGFIARAVSQGTGAAKRPKYIRSAGAHGAVWLAGGGDTLVVVEDVLSAFRVVQAGFKAMAAMGTAIDQTTLSEAVRGCAKVVGWLDPDAAGHKGFRTLRRALALHDAELYKVVSERDPKQHSRAEIQAYIKDATNADARN